MENQELKDLEERLKRQIRRRDKEIRIVGFAKKKTVSQIARTRKLIELLN